MMEHRWFYWHMVLILWPVPHTHTSSKDWSFTVTKLHWKHAAAWKGTCPAVLPTLFPGSFYCCTSYHV
jgi:hypothetical protein